MSSETLTRGAWVGVEDGTGVLVGVMACVLVGDGGGDVPVARSIVARGVDGSCWQELRRTTRAVVNTTIRRCRCSNALVLHITAFQIAFYMGFPFVLPCWMIAPFSRRCPSKVLWVMNKPRLIALPPDPLAAAAATPRAVDRVSGFSPGDAP